jgi:hypothetical protein
MIQQPHANDGQPLSEEELASIAQRLDREPAILTALINELPDPQAVEVLKALAPVIEEERRRLRLLESLLRRSMTKQA